MDPLIKAPRSVIVAADVEASEYSTLLRGIAGVSGIGGVKIGFSLGLEITLKTAVVLAKTAVTNEDIVTIYDHQKAGTDIPDMGKVFARVMANAGVDAAILFPQAGPETQRAWTGALQEKGIRVITGSEMTHPRYLAKDGGYIRDDAPMEMFELAVELGGTDFVVPGNKVEAVELYRSFFDERLGAGNYSLDAPGFIDQGGDISKTGKVAGQRWNAIVGRAITAAGDENAIHAAAVKVTAQIMA